MKFEVLLMQRDKEHHEKRLQLEKEVEELQEILKAQQNLNEILQCTLHSPFVPGSYLSSLFPLQVQVILAEVAIVEEEISCLERRIQELELCLCYEREQMQNFSFYQQEEQQQEVSRQKQRDLICELGDLKEFGEVEQLPEVKYRRLPKHRTTSLGSISEVTSCININDATASADEGQRSRRGKEQKEDQRSRRRKEQNQYQCYLNEATSSETPNKISEELIKTFISIYHKLNRTQSQLHCESTAIPKLSISCMNSRNFMSFHCKTTPYSSDNATEMLDPYGILLDTNGRTRDHGSYKKCIQITRSSLDMSRIASCISFIERLRALMQKLSMVELSFLTNKQKLAFWINIYNACIMHEFLQNGLPPSPDKLLELLNKAVMNVGGIVLNALAIEHYILRHYSDRKNGFMDEKEELLRHTYGLGYPEPNVTFALCRGTWSSPALRVYTAEDVVNELERAKVEYLEASVGITSKKKIIIPKLLHWHMTDFADDIRSLLEWIYSQLPRSASLKRSIMDCLIGKGRIPLTKMVEIHSYEAEFRYLLPI